MYSYSGWLEFVRQKIMWNSGTLEVNYSATVSLEGAEMHLEQLRKDYVHQTALAMVEDMIYGSMHQSLVEYDF
ncbi:hypothetical protein PDIG_56680 [Penicillium digitatum PHI26]|uniref:Uncharacterized protein n=2 Tax=Penicillium digitatum TaxID=36651 RepID=K9FME9_PEND2|nr:hypothetical protein PDIP_66240 [Penicillium digitatum Pd1]EKV09113.1 hypothetical protein PDIP_66240 [Penicillium digitatum Pd1]EKV10379.1 hypothetical protein PDIG_56680 [Penicillium digitatum PHI26]